MHLVDLLRAVKLAETPEEWWSAQMSILEGIKNAEQFILKRRHQVKALKEAKRAYSRTPAKTVERLRRYDKVIASLQSSEQHYHRLRNTHRYFGDALAFRMMPQDKIKVMSRNQDPGLMHGKEGQKLEIEIAEFAAKHGCRVLLHDSTHCLRMGDVTISHPERDLLIMELKTGSWQNKRTDRQGARMKILDELFREDRVKLTQESWNNLTDLGMPAAYLEQPSKEAYLVEAFEEACNLGDANFRMLKPEPGLIYLAKRYSVEFEEWMSSFAENSSGMMGPASFSVLVGRIDGKNAYVPPIMLHDISEAALLAVLSGDIQFCVFVDLGYVTAKLAEAGIEALPVLDELQNLYAFDIKRTTDAQMTGMLGPRMVHEVQYGLASLSAAIENMIGTLDLMKDFEGPEIDMAPGTVIHSNCPFCGYKHEGAWDRPMPHDVDCPAYINGANQQV